MKTMSDKNTNENVKNWLIGGVSTIAAGAIIWGSVVTYKNNQNKERVDYFKSQIENLNTINTNELSLQREAYETMEANYIDSLATIKKKNEELDSKTRVLDWQNSALESNYDALNESHNKALNKVDSLNKVIISLDESAESIEEMLREQVAENQRILEANTLNLDSLNSVLSAYKVEQQDLRKTLNAYILFRRPISEKHTNKVLIPSADYRPFNNSTFKEMKMLQKDYKRLK